MIIVYFLFWVPASLTEGGKNIYAFVTYFLMSVVCFTAVNLSYHAMLPRFSLTSQDRNVVTVIRSICSLMATLFISVLTPILLAALGGEQNQQAWSTLTLIYGCIAIVAILITFFGVKEKISVDNNNSVKEKSNVSTLQSVKILLSSRYFYISVFLFVACYITNGTSGISIYYARDVLGDANLMGLITMSGIIPMILAMPFAPVLFKKFGKRNTMLGGMILALVCAVLMLFKPSNPMWYIVLSFMKSIGTTPLMGAMYTFAGDIVDFNQWKYGIVGAGRWPGLRQSSDRKGKSQWKADGNMATAI